MAAFGIRTPAKRDGCDLLLMPRDGMQSWNAMQRETVLQFANFVGMGGGCWLSGSVKCGPPRR